MKGRKNQRRSEMRSKVLEALNNYFEKQEVRLSPSAFLVWVFLLTKRSQALPMAQVSFRAIVQATGIRSHSTVCRALKELEEKGMISRVRSEVRNFCNLYIFRSEKDREIDRGKDKEKILENEFSDSELQTKRPRGSEMDLL